MKCTVAGQKYSVFGYKAKQVRDNIHSRDLVGAFVCFYNNPRSAAVYNMGGGRTSNCSMIEAIGICEEITGNKLNWSYTEDNRSGDHMWWVSGLKRFKADYPEWHITCDVRAILQEIYLEGKDRWLGSCPKKGGYSA
jgi:CDP-paratose 2-epimerase